MAELNFFDAIRNWWFAERDSFFFFSFPPILKFIIRSLFFTQLFFFFWFVSEKKNAETYCLVDILKQGRIKELSYSLFKASWSLNLF